MTETQPNYFKNRSPTVRFAIAALLLALAFLAFWSIRLQVNIAEGGPPTLPEPNLSVSHSTQNLSKAVSVANQHNRYSAINHEIRVRHREMKRFRSHMSNIAAQKGWYLHYQPDHDIGMVMPSEELGDLTALVQDPIRWVR